MDPGMQVAEHKRGIVATAFGQFATREFWRNLFAMIVREALSAFILSLGGTLVYYVRNKANPDSNNIRNITNNGVGAVPPPSSPSNAFANGYAPKATYNPPFMGQQGGYPGFG
jgi:hypothetical protein